MPKKVTSYINVLNAIRSDASEEYQAHVPVATASNITAVGNPVLAYQTVQNEFLTKLINKIAYTQVTSMRFSNPLAVLKSGSLPLGHATEEVGINPALPINYNAETAGLNLLQMKKPEIFTAFHELNRKDYYKVSIADDELKHAFTSYANFNEFYNKIINSLYSGNDISEFILMKNAISQAYNSGKVLTMGELVDPATQTTDATIESATKKLLRTIKILGKNISFPSKKYNKASEGAYITNTPKNKLVIILRADLSAYISIDVLAGAFNMSQAEIEYRVIEVDDFGKNTDNVLALIADESFFQFRDTLNAVSGSFYNPEGRFTNFYLHIHQIISTSPLANAIILTTDPVA